MDYKRASPPDSSAKVLVSNRISALQWQAFRAGAQWARGRSAWAHGDVQTLRQWVRQCWENSPAAAESVLRRRQADALWREVLRSCEGAGAAELRVWAPWAAGVWDMQSSQSWPLERVVRPEYRGRVGRWQAAYLSALRERGWIDDATVQARLPSCELPSPLQPLVTDLSSVLPADVSLLAGLRARGWHISAYSCAETAGGARAWSRYDAEDQGTELTTALTWMRAELDRNPDARMAVVVPDLATRVRSVCRQIESIMGAGTACEADSYPVHVFVPQRATAPAIAAAVSAIGMLTDQPEFGALSRWLRSPFFCRDSAELGRRCALEIAARECINAPLGLSGASGERSGISALLERAAPELAQQIVAATGCMGNLAARLTPTEWVRRWSLLLGTLGWPGELTDWDDRQADWWDRCLRETAALTPILGNLAHADALQELLSVVRTQSPAETIPLRGVVVLEGVADVGPGYDAIWVTGLTRDLALGRARNNPLLMPQLAGDRPGGPVDLRASLERLATRCGQLILSWSRERSDGKVGPNPILAALPAWKPRAPEGLNQPRQGRRSPAGTLETVADRPTAWRARRLPGGARLLALQAQSPIRAYCEYRLAVSPIPTPQWGLSERQRGLIVHRALERLMAALATSNVETGSPVAMRRMVTRILTKVLTESVGEELARQRRQFRLEREAIGALVQELVRVESQRRGRRIAGLELAIGFECAGHSLDLKVDRVDELSDGTQVVIDYKTGRTPTARDWLGARLLEPQLPLYALATCAAGALTIALRPGQVEYRGFWPAAADIPGKFFELPPQCDWDTQMIVWRAQIEKLVCEFAAGDVRIFPNEAEKGTDPLLPLTRSLECSAAALSVIASYVPAE